MIADFLDDETKPAVVSSRMIRWVRNSCVYRLNQKMMSEKQLFDALTRKATVKFADIDVNLARQIAQIGIDFCNENKLLNDVAFADVKVTSGIRAGRSKRRIAMDLRQKGIASDVIEISVQDADDFAAAVNFARKRAFGPFRKVDLDDKQKVREFSAFARNGYASSLAFKLIGMTRKEAEEQVLQLV